MVIFLYGPDNFRSGQKLNEIIAQNGQAHKSGLNLIVIDCSNSSFQDFRNSLETISMFEKKKLVVLKNVFSNPSFEKSLEDYKKEILRSKDNIVFYERDKVDGRKSFFKFLKEKTLSHEFKLLESLSLRSWALKEFGKYGLKADQKVIDLLILYCGPDTWRIYNEIKKIACNKLNGGREVLEEDVRTLVKGNIEIDIFKAIEAVSNKNKKLSLGYIHSLLEKGGHPLYLLTMINYQFRNLILIKDLLERKTQYHLIGKKSGLHPFVVKKSYEACRHFSFSELKKIYQKIFQADLNGKTGKTDPLTALDCLLTSI